MTSIRIPPPPLPPCPPTSSPPPLPQPNPTQPALYPKITKQANFFVKVVYEPPPSVSSTDGSSHFLSGGVGSGGGADYSPIPAPERVVGVTNTEYGSVEPAWGSNGNRAACPYNQPRLQHQVTLNDYQVTINDYQVTVNDYQVTIDDYQVTLDDYQVTVHDYQVTIDDYHTR